MRRRDFIVGLGGSAAWPLTARAQQPALPVALFSSTSKDVGRYIAGLTAGLAEIGYVEGRNVAFEYRMAEDHSERLPALANDLVRRRVAVIFTAANLPKALAAKAATQALPIVFMIGADPVHRGLVASLAREHHRRYRSCWRCDAKAPRTATRTGPGRHNDGLPHQPCEPEHDYRGGIEGNDRSG
jgi:putative tryptophan/tyrosine transport system substrate-binding protein